MSSGNRTIEGSWVPNGYQQITNLAAATALTVPTNSDFALIQAEGQDVRWRDDGTDPTAAIGSVIAAGETIEYNGDLRAFKAIQVAASAKLNISFYK